jgi:hypothetical protein
LNKWGISTHLSEALGLTIAGIRMLLQEFLQEFDCIRIAEQFL